MNVETTPVCEHGITPLQLCAWRDGDLPEAAMAAVGEHVAGCPACQARLAAYDATARALQGQHVPQADDRLWHAVAARAAGSAGAPGQRFLAGRPAFRQRPTWSGVAALVALILIVASFAFAFHQRATPGAQRPAHHSPPEVLQPDWQPVTLPRGVITYAGNPFGLAVSSTDGNTVYACATPHDLNGHPNPGDTGGKVHIWLTHDRAATWTPVADVPLAREDATACWLLTDGNKDSTVLALVTWQSHPGFILDEHQSAAFISHDSGAAWQQLTDPSRTQIVDFASAGTTTYAMVWKTGSGGSGGSYGLYASGDSLRSWREIDTSLLAKESLAGFSVRPDTGELLLETVPGDLPAGRNITHLWLSDNSGQTWTQRSAPDADRFLVALPVPGQPWRLCGDNFEASANPTLPTALACSTDGGKTWRQRPVLQSSASDVEASATPAPGSTPGTTNDGQHLIIYTDITASGDVLATDLVEVTRLYRLTPNSDQWQYLGVVPGPNTANTSISYVPVPQSTGVLWATISGSHNSSAAAIPTPIYTAAYPAG